MVCYTVTWWRWWKSFNSIVIGWHHCCIHVNDWSMMTQCCLNVCLLNQNTMEISCPSWKAAYWSWLTSHRENVAMGSHFWMVPIGSPKSLVLEEEEISARILVSKNKGLQRLVPVVDPSLWASVVVWKPSVLLCQTQLKHEMAMLPVCSGIKSAVLDCGELCSVSISSMCSVLHVSF